MEQIDVFKAKIVRRNVNTPWGFRLEGGAEHGLPLKVHRVSQSGSKLASFHNDFVQVINGVHRALAYF